MDCCFLLRKCIQNHFLLRRGETIDVYEIIYIFSTWGGGGFIFAPPPLTPMCCCCCWNRKCQSSLKRKTWHHCGCNIYTLMCPVKKPLFFVGGGGRKSWVKKLQKNFFTEVETPKSIFLCNFLCVVWEGRDNDSKFFNCLHSRTHFCHRNVFLIILWRKNKYEGTIISHLRRRKKHN